MRRWMWGRRRGHGTDRGEPGGRRPLDEPGGPALPVERILRAWSVLEPQASADLDDPEAARREIDQFLLGHAGFPPPAGQGPALRGEPDEVDAYRRVADAALRVTLLDPDGDEAQTVADIQMHACRCLWQALGSAEQARLGLAMAVVAFQHVRDGRHEAGRTAALDGVRQLNEAALHDARRAQLPLVLSLEAAARAEMTVGRHADAVVHLERAVTVLDAVAAREGGEPPERAELGRLLDAARAAEAAPTGDGRGEDRAAGGRGRDRRLRQADELFDTGVTFSRNGQLAQADRSLRRAVAAYQELDGPHAAAGLARALWRRSMVLYASGKVPEALQVGREAAAAWRRASMRRDAEPGWWVEGATTLTDVSVMLGNAGEVDEAVAFASAAVETLRTVRGPNTADLATALHNLATTKGQRAQARVPPMAPNAMAASAHAGTSEQETVAAMREALAAVEEAVVLRERLANGPVPINRWELANSLLLRGRFHTILGDVAAGSADLARAVSIIGGLGPGANDLLAEVELNRRLLRMRGAG